MDKENSIELRKKNAIMAYKKVIDETSGLQKEIETAVKSPINLDPLTQDTPYEIKEQKMQSGYSRSEHLMSSGIASFFERADNICKKAIRKNNNSLNGLCESSFSYVFSDPNNSHEKTYEEIVKLQQEQLREKLVYGRYAGAYIKKLVEQNNAIAQIKESGGGKSSETIIIEAIVEHEEEKAKEAAEPSLENIVEPIEQIVPEQIKTNYTEPQIEKITDANPKFIESEVPPSYTQQPTDIITGQFEKRPVKKIEVKEGRLVRKVKVKNGQVIRVKIEDEKK